MDDTRIVLEEQNEKNEHLERKFRKVDSELIEVGRRKVAVISQLIAYL